MAVSTGTILGGSRHCPDRNFSTRPRSFDRGSDSEKDRSGPTPMVRTWFGQNLSEVPGIGHTQDNRTDQTNEVWCEPDTYQPTSSHPIGRKRRAVDRLDMRPDVDREVRRKGSRWGTPYKRDLFGLDGPYIMSSGSEVAQAQLRWTPDGEYPAVAQSGQPYNDESLEETQSPRVEPEDAVARLQKELAECRKEFGYGGARGPANSSVDIGAQVFGEVQLGTISASI